MIRGLSLGTVVPPSVWRLGKFLAVGASGTVLNVAIFSVLTVQFGVHHLVASATAFELTLVSNYLINNNWTFSDRRRQFFSIPSLARY